MAARAAPFVAILLRKLCAVCDLLQASGAGISVTKPPPVEFDESANRVGWLRVPNRPLETGPRLTLGRRKAPSRGEGQARPGGAGPNQSFWSAERVIADQHDLRTWGFSLT
jgi:hypothetical protein